MSGREKNPSLKVLFGLSWIVSLFFATSFLRNTGFPPARSLETGDIIYLALALFFAFMPFYSRIRIGNYLEIEREVARTKEELGEFKSEVRQSISVLSTNVNTIGNLSNQVTVNLPGIVELEELKRKIDASTTPGTRREAEEIRAGLLLESEDTVMALARTRIRMEYLLRKILGKRTSVNELRNQSIKFMGIRQMFNMFLAESPQYKYLFEPFMYVNQVCNAAVHAQRVSEEQANEALDLGARIIATLSDVAGVNNGA